MPSVATSPVTEFLTAAATNPDFFFVGGSSGNYKFMNRISAGFSGTDGTPSGDGFVFRVRRTASRPASSSIRAQRP